MKSDLNALNTVLPSGLVSGTIINILGRYMSGKTLLSLQESFYVCSQEGGNIQRRGKAAHGFVLQNPSSFGRRYMEEL